MNLFLLRKRLDKAAKAHCNAHVVKMILESAQLLYAAHHVLNAISEDEHMRKWAERAPNGGMKLTHKNHPMAIWVRRSEENYKIVVELLRWLLVEYTKRYGKTHKTQEHFEWLSQNPPDCGTPCFDAYQDYKESTITALATINGHSVLIPLVMPPSVAKKYIKSSSPNAAIHAYRALYRAKRRGKHGVAKIKMEYYRKTGKNTRKELKLPKFLRSKSSSRK